MKQEQGIIEVRGTGNQAPYGIGEVIATFAYTHAGWKKAMRKAAYWYNPASIWIGERQIEIDWSVVRKCDRGYVIE
jgi:hypothetical protein